MIAVYFKHMYSPSSQIVQVAHDGLKSVLATQAKLPKDILQTGLRPILVNLADARRLSVSGLEGLSRFLELLTNYFKVEIGVKLLDHFKSLADPAMLIRAADRPYEDNQDIARMVRLVNVFRLLPSTANTFLKDLTNLVVDTEERLHQSKPGPFTENLALYFDRYPADAAAFLFEKIRDTRSVRTFRNVLASGKAPAFAKELSDQIDKLCEICFRQPDVSELVLPGVQLIMELAKTSDDWFDEHLSVLSALVAVWRSIVEKSRHAKNQPFDHVFSREPALLLELFTGYLSTHKHVELLFHVVEALEIKTAFDCADVPYFLYGQIATPDDLQYKREILENFLSIYTNSGVSSAFKTHAFRLIVNPLLYVHFTRKASDDAMDPLITGDIAARLAKDVWAAYIAQMQRNEIDDNLVIELLQMSNILVQYCPNVLTDQRKEIVKVAWDCMKTRDATARHMGYLLGARFFTAFESPQNFIRNTWTGLLKTKESEARAIYRKAIDVLADCLLIRDPPPAVGLPFWATAVKRVLVEDGHTTPQLVTICELIVSHGDLFYDSRDLFVGLMANSLTKLGFVPGATADMKKLTIDIVELIFRWERRRMTGSLSIKEADKPVEDIGKRAASSDPPSAKKQRLDRAGTVASTSSSGGWQLPVHVRELITSYLVRLVSTSAESLARGGLTSRALNLLREILGPEGLPGVTAKLSFFQRTMGGVSLSNSAARHVSL